MDERQEFDLDIYKERVQKYYTKASTKGGQNANKNENCVMLIHEATGIRVVCKDSKSKSKNEEQAYKELKRRVINLYTGKVDEEVREERSSQMNTGDAKRRTYRVIDGYAKDHITGKQVRIKDVKRGKIHLFHTS